MAVIELLTSIRDEIGPVMPFDLNKEPIFIFDLTGGNTALGKVNKADPLEFSRYIKSTLSLNKSRAGIGRYAEDRTIYLHSGLFNSSSENRTIHLGIDIWTDEMTEVICPLKGAVHSFRNNAGTGDYGPTVILEHNINGTRFYTLYGHLTMESIADLTIGQAVEKGEIIGRIGSHEVNGRWPPHLHFQIIADMNGKTGDFPGVCSKSQREYYLRLCPNPNFILRIDKLDIVLLDTIQLNNIIS